MYGFKNRGSELSPAPNNVAGDGERNRELQGRDQSDCDVQENYCCAPCCSGAIVIFGIGMGLRNLETTNLRLVMTKLPSKVQFDFLRAILVVHDQKRVDSYSGGF